MICGPSLIAEDGWRNTINHTAGTGDGTYVFNSLYGQAQDPAKLETFLGVKDPKTPEYETNLYGDYDSRNHLLTVNRQAFHNAALRNSCRTEVHNDRDWLSMQIANSVIAPVNGLGSGTDLRFFVDKPMSRPPVCVANLDKDYPHHEVYEPFFGRGYYQSTDRLSQRAPATDGGSDMTSIDMQGIGHAPATNVHPLSMQMMAYQHRDKQSQQYAQLDPHSMAGLLHAFGALINQPAAPPEPAEDPAAQPKK